MNGKSFSRSSWKNIHSGVRVKIQSKFSSIEHEFKSTSSSNRIQTMINRLRMDSEASALTDNGERSIEMNVGKLSPIETTSSWKTQFSRKDQKEKLVNSIATQTMIIEQIDREISCHLMTKDRSLSSSSISTSQTSTSNDHSAPTETTSTATTSSSHTASNDSQNHSPDNTDRNNNASDTEVKCIDEEDLNRQKNITQRVGLGFSQNRLSMSS